MTSSSTAVGYGHGGGISPDQAQVHFITKTKKVASVPIAEVLSRIHIDVLGDRAVIRGTRTAFHALATRGSAETYLPDGTPLWRLSFRAQHARRPPKAASKRLMKARDWTGCLFVCTNLAAHAASSSTAAVPEATYGPCRYGVACRHRFDPDHCAKYSHPDGAEPPVAVLVVEYVLTEAEDWVVHLRSLSVKAASAASRLCRNACGMLTSQAEGKTFDTCCKQCAKHTSQYGRCVNHDETCAGRAPDFLLDDFRDTADLMALLPAGVDRSSGALSLERTVSEERRAKAGEEALKECKICFCDDAESDWCSCSHSFCKDCMARHVQVSLEDNGILPACPLSAECGHLLTREQVEHVIGSSTGADAIMSRFDLLAQRLGLQALGAFPCARETCSDWIVPSDPGKQQLVECPRCKIRFCSVCKRKPFHWRCRCEDVAQVDEAWHQWLREDRDTYIASFAATDPEYRKLLDQLGSKKAEQLRMLEAAEARKKEFEEMEDWKARNCKCCPQCRRVINKIDGCDSMLCGQNYHGGDVQNGCGARFNWSSAPAYVPQDATHISKVTLDRHPEASGRAFWECEPGVFLRCAMCKFSIRGPLFLCIDCMACCACLRCANGLGSAAGGHHDPHSHVFKVLWKLEDLGFADLRILKENKLTTRHIRPRHDEKLSPEEQLLFMGFSEAQVRQALAMSDGTVEGAVAVLMKD
eukprot:TRINITY_DN1306_c0_g1_i1.p1 TRINITY_DN1306_c0_g1~~TRINITY_DN1306_c0_g1_i1.p1  ORF type:complete len:699 (-),score=84.45 TRINITY_DN1306_c0_g1_i1:307-2403(-)